MRAWSFTGDEGNTRDKIGAPPQLDITQPEGPVVIEVDHRRKVMYVHIEGFTVLRICRAEGYVVEEHK